MFCFAINSVFDRMVRCFLRSNNRASSKEKGSKTISKNLSVPHKTIQNTVGQFKELGNAEKSKEKSHSPATTALKIVKPIREKIRKHPCRFVRQTMTVIGIRPRRVRQTVKNRLFTLSHLKMP